MTTFTIPARKRVPVLIAATASCCAFLLFTDRLLSPHPTMMAWCLAAAFFLSVRSERLAALAAFSAALILFAMTARAAFLPGILDANAEVAAAGFLPLVAAYVAATLVAGFGVLRTATGAASTAKLLDGGFAATLFRVAMAFFPAMGLSVIARYLATDGAIYGADIGLAEAGANIVAGLAFSRIATGAGVSAAPRIVRIIAECGFAIGMIAGLIPILITANPLFVRSELGTFPFDQLLAAYLVPGAALVAAGWFSGRNRPAILRRAVIGVGMALVALWGALEIRHLHQGPDIGSWRGVAQGELWAYDAYLVFLAVLCFVLSRRGPVTAATKLAEEIGWVLLAAVSIKVFLIDLGGLEGLTRVSALIGLGLSIVAIVVVRRHFVKDAPAR